METDHHKKRTSNDGTSAGDAPKLFDVPQPSGSLPPISLKVDELNNLTEKVCSRSASSQLPHFDCFQIKKHKDKKIHKKDREHKKDRKEKKHRDTAPILTPAIPLLISSDPDSGIGDSLKASSALPSTSSEKATKP